MKKIIHIINSLDMGGTETALYRLLKLTQNTHSLHIIVLNQAGHYTDKIAELGISIEYLHIRKNPVFALLKLKKSLRRLQPDIVQTWLYHADLIGGLVAKYCRIKRIIWSVRCEGVDLKKSTALVKFLCAKLSHIIPTHITVNSHNALENHVQSGYNLHKMHLIHNGFDATLFSPGDHSFKNTLQRLRPVNHLTPLSITSTFGEITDSQRTSLFIGTLARFHPDKGYDTLIACIDTVCDAYPHVYFVLCGKGCHPENLTLIKLLKNLRHAKHVLLIDGTNNPVGYLNALDIFVLPSHTESFPNSLAEAMLCELPCITANVGDAACLSGNQNSVIPPKNPIELGKACLTLLHQTPAERKRLGRMAREHITRYYTLERYQKKMEALYTQEA